MRTKGREIWLCRRLLLCRSCLNYHHHPLPPLRLNLVAQVGLHFFNHSVPLLCVLTPGATIDKPGFAEKFKVGPGEGGGCVCARARFLMEMAGNEWS